MSSPAPAATVTAHQLQGRARGALFGTIFGGLWLTLALQTQRWQTPAALVIAGVVGAILMVAAIVLMRQAGRLPRVPPDRQTGRSFLWINVAQWGLIAVLAAIFNRLHLQPYVLTMVAVVVGVHFFPLAQIFRAPLWHVTGVATLLWAAVALLLMPQHPQGPTAVGMGVILWMSASVTLTRAYLVARTARAPPAVSAPG